MKFKILLSFLIICVSRSKCARYVLPEITIKAVEGGGVQISMPVTQGEEIELFGFHGNVNKNIRGKEQGEIARSATSPIGTKWILNDKNVQLKIGDKIHYWIFAQSNRLGFDREDQTFEVREFVKLTDGCQESISKFNNEETLCKGDIIFEDNFNGDKLNENIWEAHNYIPTYLENIGDKEFVIYENNNENIYLHDGNLNLKPTVGSKNFEYDYDLGDRCTFIKRDKDQDNLFACSLSQKHPGATGFHIVPKVKSARVVSKKSFKYGRIEIRAFLSEGDWIVPQAVLLPKDYKYGPGYQSGAIYVVYGRGNKNIDEPEKRVMLGPAFTGAHKTTHLQKIALEPGFHTFRVEWTPDGIVTWVDDTKQTDGKIPAGGYSALVTDGEVGSWKSSRPSKNAPFDQYFQLHLAVPVGGRYDFPDSGVKYGVRKPWSNTAPKAIVDFLRSNFESTWTEPTFKIDYVKVYAI